MTPEIEELENILDSILRGIQEALQSGEILNEDLQRQAANEIEYLTTELDRLYSEQTPVSPPTAPSAPAEPILNESYPSSNVNSFGYNPETQQLYVKFQGDYPQENGPVYSYEGVPKVIFDLFQKGAIPARTDGENEWGEWWKGKVPSLGASLFTLIKNGGYSYKRVS